MMFGSCYCYTQTWNTANHLHKQNLQNLLYTTHFEHFQSKMREHLENLHQIQKKLQKHCLHTCILFHVWLHIHFADQ